MKRKLHNFNTMDFLFFLIAILPIVYPLFIMLITSFSTESTSLIDIESWQTYFENFYDSNYFNNILGLESFNEWFALNVIGNNESYFLMLLLEFAEWYLVVYLLRMAFDFLMIIPNIVHNFVHKIGGTSSD